MGRLGGVQARTAVALWSGARDRGRSSRPEFLASSPPFSPGARGEGSGGGGGAGVGGARVRGRFTKPEADDPYFLALPPIQFQSLLYSCYYAPFSYSDPLSDRTTYSEKYITIVHHWNTMYGE